MVKTKVYAVDFGGTLCENIYPKIGKPKNEVINYIKNLKAQGNKIILWTCRNGNYLEDAINWCAEIGLIFDAVNENLPEYIKQYGNDSRKIGCDRYIDDKCISVSEITKLVNNSNEKEVRTVRIEIRNDSVLLDGYVNAVARDSKPLITPHGKVVEQIEPRAFERALSRAENVELLLNHNKDRKLGSTKDGNLELFEDNIGLRAICTVTDAEVVQKAKDKKLKGWSFGQYVNKDRLEERANDIPRRHVEDLDLFEVSIIDDRLSPCYVGTSIEQRADAEVIAEQRGDTFTAVIVDNTKVDYSAFESRINQLIK